MPSTPAIRSAIRSLALLSALGLAGAAAASDDAAAAGGAPPDLAPPATPAEAARAALAAACAEAAAYSERFGGRALLVLHRGEVVFERYADGWGPQRLHPLASGTKSFVGVIAAAAVQDGLIEWDAPVARWIVEWGEPIAAEGAGGRPAAQDETAADSAPEMAAGAPVDPPREAPLDPRLAMTIRQLLDLSSGLDPAEATLGAAGGGPVSRDLGDDRLERGRTLTRQQQPADKYAASVGLDLAAPPGERFAYGPSHFLLFGEVMNRALRDAHAEGSGQPRSIEAYLDARILRPIGLGGATRAWGRDRAGNLALPGGALLTARAWAQFGELIRRGGRATGPDGEEIVVIDEAVLRRCFEPSAANPAYGLTWWLPSRGGEAALVADGVAAPDRGARPRRDRLRERLIESQANRTLEVADPISGAVRPVEVWMAAGLGRQRLLVLPELDLVVVRFGRNMPGVQRFDDRELLAGIAIAAAGVAAAEPTAPIEPVGDTPAPDEADATAAPLDPLPIDRSRPN